MWLDPYRAFSSDGPELTALQVVLPPTYFCPVHAGPPRTPARPPDGRARAAPPRLGCSAGPVVRGSADRKATTSAAHAGDPALAAPVG